MGCCAGRIQTPEVVSRSRIILYIRECKMDTLSCAEIRKIENEDFIPQTYEILCKKFNIHVPFEIFALNGRVLSFDLKAGLLLFSKDTVENKQTLLNEIANNDRRKMRYLEWRYQLINERLANSMKKDKFIEPYEHDEWVASSRLRVANNLIQEFEDIKSDSLVSFKLVSIR